MKLVSLLNLLCPESDIEVYDESEAIDKSLLFSGTVEECRKYTFIKNGVLTAITANNDCMCALVNIDYQKRKCLEHPICGTCAHAVPAVFGRSKYYVECTNAKHKEKFCKHDALRARNTRGCKEYKEGWK